MTRVLARAVSLAAIYLLVLTSVEPFDIAAGLLFGLAVALLLRPRGPASQQRQLSGGPLGLAGALLSTAREMVIGSWRVVQFCLRAGSAAPGFVEVPREQRTRGDLALWGLLTGEAPDEVPVDIDEGRDVMVVHLVDASDPDGVRERHHSAYERMRRS